MDIRKVKKLIELLEESGIDELEIHEGEESVRISRHSKQRVTQCDAGMSKSCWINDYTIDFLITCRVN